MSLLQNLSYPDYKFALTLKKEQCEIVVKLADLKISFSDNKKPGEILLKYLDRRGYSEPQYKKFLAKALNVKTIVTYYKPQTKVAILIANDRYEHLSKLATPSIDCSSLAEHLKDLGFITVTVKNTKSCDLKNVLKSIFSVIPEDSYCLIFYAGHGFEMFSLKCILCIDCPTDNIQVDHCVPETWILKEAAKCKPELCILIMDMCRMYLDRDINKNIYESMPDEDFPVHRYLIIEYSTQPSQAAYEVLQIECSKTIEHDVTYELQTGDTDKIIPGASQYVNALCARIKDNSDINLLFDDVNTDVEKAMKKQRPIKVQHGSCKKSLYDPTIGDIELLRNKIQEIIEQFQNKCDILNNW